MSPQEFQILFALGRSPLHGYAIMQAVEQHTEGRMRIQTGALYRVLKRLLGNGWIGEVEAPAGEDSRDGRRRYYALLPAGRSALAKEAARMEAALDAARAARLITLEDR